jgi:hypothetical protein
VDGRALVRDGRRLVLAGSDRFSFPGAMKPLVVAAQVAVMALCAGCGRHLDPIATRPSPDGAIIAASNRNSGEFAFVEQADEVRLYQRGGRLSDGVVILSYGEDDRPPVFGWTSANNLTVQLPCGWWSGLTNHYQLPRTGRIIDISYSPPPSTCPAQITSSTAPSKAIGTAAPQ